MRKMRLIRCEQGKTLDDLANAIFLTSAYLRQFEVETLDLNIQYKKKIADLLGTTVKEISKHMSTEERNKYFHSNGAFKGNKKNNKNDKNDKKKHKEKQEKKQEKIIKVCKNQLCRLNENCFCNSDPVKEGRATCMGQYKEVGPYIEFKNQIAFGKKIEWR